MIYLPDTNCCIEFLRGRNAKLIARWQEIKPTQVVLCSVVIYELRHGAERSNNPAREREKIDQFLKPYSSVPFDDDCAQKCAGIRFQLERLGLPIGPYDLQIAATALHHEFTLVTHNTSEFGRIPTLKVEDWES